MSKECLDKTKSLTKDDSWIDDIVDGEPEEANVWQIGIIEGLQQTSSYEWSGQAETLTYSEAEELIVKLKENNNPKDPKDQYEKMFRNGMFDSENI